MADIGRAITSRIRSANGIEGVDRPGLLEDVSSARRDLDRARDGRPNAQARLRAAIVRAARGGESQRDVAARAGVQPAVRLSGDHHERRSIRDVEWTRVRARAHRADVLEIMGRVGVGTSRCSALWREARMDPTATSTCSSTSPVRWVFSRCRGWSTPYARHSIRPLTSSLPECSSRTCGGTPNAMRYPYEPQPNRASRRSRGALVEQV